jgi:hypothetical protein
VFTKPPPISLHDIEIEADAALDRPLFPNAQSDDEQPVVSDPETLSDTELNIYGSRLATSD